MSLCLANNITLSGKLTAGQTEIESWGKEGNLLNDIGVGASLVESLFYTDDNRNVILKLNFQPSIYQF